MPPQNAPRRPSPAPVSRALPTLAALTLAGALAQGCIGEAQAQTAPDAGVRRPPHPHPPTPPTPPQPPMPPPPGGIGRVHPGNFKHGL